MSIKNKICSNFEWVRKTHCCEVHNQDFKFMNKLLILFSLSDAGKVWRTESEAAWQTEDQSFKRTSPHNAACATATTPLTDTGTTVATGGGAPPHPHLSPSIAAPVTTLDHRSATTFQPNQDVSPGTIKILSL